MKHKPKKKSRSDTKSLFSQWTKSCQLGQLIVTGKTKAKRKVREVTRRGNPFDLSNNVDKTETNQNVIGVMAFVQYMHTHTHKTYTYTPLKLVVILGRQILPCRMLFHPGGEMYILSRGFLYASRIKYV